MASNASKFAGKDFYKILRVEYTATAKEIKLAYYKLALTLHPDKHDGCSKKEAQFKIVNEAYDVLRDEGKRREYDFVVGHRYNRNRRTAPPKDYRKVYTSRPPPDWKTVWDHAHHYEMHYGDGFRNLAVEQMRRSLEAEGRFEYRSPLGKGFHFSSEPLHMASGDRYNPYSKRTPQGPPKVVFEYTEGTRFNGKEHIARKERIVEEMHTRRRERQRQRGAQQQHHAETATPPFAKATSPFANYSTQATAGRNSGRTASAGGGGDCVIL